MGIVNSAIVINGTASIAGGTSVTLTDDSKQVKNGRHLVNAAITDFRVRPEIYATVRQPSLESDGVTYTKARKEVQITLPKLLTSLKTSFPTGRIILEDHPEMTAAEQLTLLSWMVSVMIDADWAAFWASGSTS